MESEKNLESRKRQRPLYEDDDKEEEVEKRARLTIEEALSNSKIRACPFCKVRVTKGTGCNNIRCVCNKVYCFRCGQDTGACFASRCRPSEFLPSLKTAAFTACENLKKIYPQLTFKQCCQIVAESWTTEEEPEEHEAWGTCDNDLDVEPRIERLQDEEREEDEASCECENDVVLEPRTDGIQDEESEGDEEWEECENDVFVDVDVEPRTGGPQDEESKGDEEWKECESDVVLEPHTGGPQDKESEGGEEWKECESDVVLEPHTGGPQDEESEGDEEGGECETDVDVEPRKGGLQDEVREEGQIE